MSNFIWEYGDLKLKKNEGLGCSVGGPVGPPTSLALELSCSGEHRSLQLRQVSKRMTE